MHEVRGQQQRPPSLDRTTGERRQAPRKRSAESACALHQETKRGTEGDKQEMGQGGTRPPHWTLSIARSDEWKKGTKACDWPKWKGGRCVGPVAVPRGSASKPSTPDPNWAVTTEKEWPPPQCQKGKPGIIEARQAQTNSDLRPARTPLGSDAHSGDDDLRLGSKSGARPRVALETRPTLGGVDPDLREHGTPPLQWRMENRPGPVRFVSRVPPNPRPEISQGNDEVGGSGQQQRNLIMLSVSRIRFECGLNSTREGFRELLRRVGLTHCNIGDESVSSPCILHVTLKPTPSATLRLLRKAPVVPEPRVRRQDSPDRTAASVRARAGLGSSLVHAPVL
ncbi:predicted protein [Chaetomium globosum CBS 148.51]|uniref:Uncharacterized protein n=1 Tax=Chaetomium globosum (strain ATCC 6205 / CBS 148.51 / DSM 1962 / NBRC 6347 / NRRL 1970) TaxID=306901 RepID=Q2HDN6_CHAGB|nr:uncharacterized protein CHGG_01668 [Chaetomium globosum CBS 148.51]EAQ93433.1 predicted protein [Chaetomium globosum CBS 148.51]